MVGDVSQWTWRELHKEKVITLKCRKSQRWATKQHLLFRNNSYTRTLADRSLMLGSMVALLRILHLHFRQNGLMLIFSLFDSWAGFVESLEDGDIDWPQIRCFVAYNWAIGPADLPEYPISEKHHSTTPFSFSSAAIPRKTDPPVSARNKPRPGSYTTPQNFKPYIHNLTISSHLPIYSNLPH